MTGISESAGASCVTPGMKAAPDNTYPWPGLSHCTGSGEGTCAVINAPGHGEVNGSVLVGMSPALRVIRWRRLAITALRVEALTGVSV